MRRVILMVMDSLGVGALPDAAEYGDEGAGTLSSICATLPDLSIPNLERLGIGCIEGVTGPRRVERAAGAFGRLAETSKGKDTITGHWEIAGLRTDTPFQTFSRFPDKFIEEFEKAIGVGILGNYAASGTEIIEALGDEHKQTGKPIVYTSADSVFQIAANTEVIPLPRLYEICEIARHMLVDDLLVGRVIARPFVEENGVYTRTSDRKDYAVSPPALTLLDHILEQGQTVYAVGKISDIFNGQGISRSVHTRDNMDGVDQTLAAMKEDFTGLIFTNLVDFDSKYGHRRDPLGYGRCLMEFDSRLPEILGAMKEDEALFLCADHGNDPCHSGWDHTREYVPFLACGAGIKEGVNLGTRPSFADIGATVSQLLGVKETEAGASFAQEILK